MLGVSGGFTPHWALGHRGRSRGVPSSPDSHWLLDTGGSTDWAHCWTPLTIPWQWIGGTACFWWLSTRSTDTILAGKQSDACFCQVNDGKLAPCSAPVMPLVQGIWALPSASVGCEYVGRVRWKIPAWPTETMVEELVGDFLLVFARAGQVLQERFLVARPSFPQSFG